MKYILLFCFIATLNSYAQEQEFFYATMSLDHAEELTREAPQEIEILSANYDIAAVKLTAVGGHELHNKILTHGPGYIYRNSREEAIKAIEQINSLTNRNTNTALDFTITEDATVIPTLDLIQAQNIEDHIITLENYGTRYHNRASATQAAVDLKARWETMAADFGRDDVSVRFFNHSTTPMPSVILTITGAVFPDEYVIVGAHLDSTTPNNDNAPGADDDASGIATITEATRALFEVGFRPQRTIEIMAYAAEEIGLVGSGEIASQYANTNVNVVAVSQFDMTLFNGSTTDVTFITDFTDSDLTSYMMELLDHYNTSGPHLITYGTSVCNYGCSDHASWTDEGFLAAFPFEANFGQHNDQIHTTGDTFSHTNTATHSVKFAKLCAEFLIEVAKNNNTLSINESILSSIFVTIRDNRLTYDLTATEQDFTGLQLFDIQGKTVAKASTIVDTGSVTLPQLSKGVYIVAFTMKNNTLISKKVIVN